MIPSSAESSIDPPKPTEAAAFLERLLRQQASPAAASWLKEQQQAIREKGPNKLYLAFSQASRFFETKGLQLSPEEEAEADKLCAGFRPRYWNQQQAARALLLVALAGLEEAPFIGHLTRLVETADVAEQTAFYTALPLFPYPLALRKSAAEGLRTNMTIVFDAIALHNPYPAAYLEEKAWNQLVLKAVFLDRPLYQIWGADKRANADLAGMLLDFAHERWAAQRSVSPEIWRFIGPYLQKETMPDIRRVSEQGSSLEQEAVLLACSTSTLPEAQELLNQHKNSADRIMRGSISWSSLGQHYHGV